MAKRRNLRAGAAATTGSRPNPTQAAQESSTDTSAGGGTAVTVAEKPQEPARLRDQPFTMEHWAATLPEVDATEETANGPLSPEEQVLLAECHRAVDNERTAKWMLGYALEVVSRRRLYRGDGTRTWEQYLAEDHDGMVKSEAHRLMSSWRLGRAVQKHLGRPAPSSHLQQMLTYANYTSDEQAAEDYAALYTAHQEGRVRLVAAQVGQRVVDAIEAAKDVPDPTERRRAVSDNWSTAPVAALPAQSTSERDPGKTDTAKQPDPMDAAVNLLHHAKEAIEHALADSAAREARSHEDAQRQQNAIRKAGRILSKVTVGADDVIDAEVVEDPSDT
ncbi:hypothetical protein [Streptomyces sp. CC224E]|uniref:hypothetical protein n=3 Tax=unclassified Streptomyces TaxID=2593676 RepID=UPI00278C5DA5|nr:hypothetical protein [Streptomyces sp. CC224E]